MWYFLQIALTLLVMWLIDISIGLKNRGLAPVVIGLFIAFLATGLLARLIDWLKTPTGVHARNNSESQVISSTRAGGHTSNSPKLISRLWTRQDRR